MVDLFAGEPIPRQEKVAVLRREVEMRKRVYGGLVAKGKMKLDDAERGIAVMQAILGDYLGSDGHG